MKDQAVHSRKLLCLEELLLLRQRYRDEGKSVVWTNGCFDLIHPGHIRSLRAARRLGDVLIVGLNSDESVRQLKGHGRPILTATERLEVLAALECIDHIIVFDESTPEAMLAQLRPDVHCKGAEYAPPNGKPIPEAGVVMAYGGRIEYLPYLDCISTTKLIKRIQVSKDETTHAHE